VETVLYLLPAIIALKRRHRHVWAIVIMNIFLGWTGFAWVFVLAWACVDVPGPIRGRSPEPEPAAPGLVEGTIRSIEDHGTIITLWIEDDTGRSRPVSFDHRPFRWMARVEGGDLVGRRIASDGATIEFLD
jgi:hypothetical protein